MAQARPPPNLVPPAQNTQQLNQQLKANDQSEKCLKACCCCCPGIVDQAADQNKQAIQAQYNQAHPHSVPQTMPPASSVPHTMPPNTPMSHSMH
uniref:Uncharacterized protein n=1 Tax=Eutreptiella gymnastica TaxID=73025 RepID=A0A7S4C7G4_9EUGL|eukprot:CAMPEP_0174312098 /NCGR_PEP_ID=MMETSP0810-20121108/4087_1 /TAXON_ID=73025 ORGANISM="Eutreptiella gymnastica-like, Strain CCMP1594" /NCGR_SAMPLE_ID=MMETSP0810 /ASSEMBLY_ACC=CAM_ASM_000659 /LENGTH=93 /DNA_ID=CAMNT_0015420425 /DNA_START=35 /DNA_END=316 /DNA_ORIENTATION=+